MVTLRELAERLGCTRSTVSYALRNHPHVAAETRRAVQQLARELGWRPNAQLAQHMAMVRATHAPQNQPNLAIIINKSRAALADEATPRLHLAGARARADELGYHADVINLAETPLPPARLRQILRARGIKGIIFIATLGTTLPEDDLRIGADYATAVVGVRYPNLAYHVAISDLKVTGHTAMLALRERGFRRPGAVLPRRLDQLLAWAFTGGVYTGQMELPVRDRVPILLVGEHEIYLPENSFGTIRAWVEREGPDALLTTDARHLIRCLAGSPRLPVFSLDLHPGQPVAGGVDQRAEAVGAAGVDLVVAQLHRGEVGLPPIQRALQVEGAWRDLGRARAPRKHPARPAQPATEPAGPARRANSRLTASIRAESRP